MTSMKQLIPRSVKAPVRTLVKIVPYLLPNRLGVLPDYLIIGAMKGGTTSLYNYLIQHPNVEPARQKEVHFFDVNYQQGAYFYRATMPRMTRKLSAALGLSPQFITGEATAEYIFHPYGAERIHTVLPHVRLIALLRNPIERAFSHYQHFVRLGRETCATFEEALALEEARITPDLEMLKQKPYHNLYDYRSFSYLKRGFYIDQFEQWMRYFPREQMLILKSEEFYADTPRVVGEVCAFLGLPACDAIQFEVYNQGQGGQIKAETRARLAEIYRPYNERLYQFLGRDMGWA